MAHVSGGGHMGRDPLLYVGDVDGGNEGEGPTEPPVRVLIVDDQPPFREAARMVVEMTDGFEVAGEAVDGLSAVSMVTDLEPDLVLMDVQMPGMDGLEATRRIAELPNPPLVLVMSTHESGDYERPARSAGAIGFVAKSEFSMEVLSRAWEEAGSGRSSSS